MTLQSVILGLCLATLLGALFHLWRDGGWVLLVIYLIAANLGFWIGHWIAGMLAWQMGRIGPLNLVGGILGSFLLLFIAYWLARFDSSRGGSRV